MANAIFIDTTVCTGCRGCQVACKQWHDLPAEMTRNRGSYENPPDLSFNTYKLVRMSEKVIDGKLKWLFFPEQCRHCLEAPCLEAAGDETAIFRDDATGAIIYSANTKELDAEEVISACPYNVPRKAKDGTLAKCDMCHDRVKNGLTPACVKTCPSGAMHFGSHEQMRQLADQRLAEVRSRYPDAMLADPEDVSVIYLLAYSADRYFENAVGAASSGMTRQMALKRLIRPLTRAARRLSV